MSLYILMFIIIMVLILALLIILISLNDKSIVSCNECNELYFLKDAKYVRNEMVCGSCYKNAVKEIKNRARFDSGYQPLIEREIP